MAHVSYILSTILSLSFSASQITNGSSGIKIMPPFMVASREPEEEKDPGKAITDDPHGPDPHGPSPHDEVHDKELPANSPDKYFSRRGARGELN